MRIIVGVDLILGPLLTLVVYKHGKPGLRFDLTLIGLVQSICLAAGVWIVYSERPLAMVYVDGHFYSMNAKAYEETNTPVPDLSGFPGPYPKWVQIVLPEDSVGSGIIQSDIFREGRPMRTATRYYKAFEANETFLNASADIREIEFRDTKTKLLPNWLKEHQGNAEDFLFYPFGARYQYVYFAFDQRGEKVAILPVNGPA